MYNKIEVEIRYANKVYPFKFGSEAYIFHTGIYNEIDRKFSLKALLQYTALVHDAYCSDNNRTPLGELADYAAENWKKVKHLEGCGLLERFYEQCF